MRKIMMLAVSLFVVGLSADEIGHVEFNLPSKDWKLGNELEGKAEGSNSKTLIYIPKKDTIENAKESFGAVEVDLPSGKVDQESIEKMYKLQFPNAKSNVKILEKTSNSITYEWSISDDKGQKGIYGWTKIFTGDKETVLLTYQNEDVSKVNELEPIWTKVLKDAKEKDEVKSTKVIPESN